MHFAGQKTYALLVTFLKTEKELPRTGLYGTGLCPWAEEAEQCDGAVHLPGAGRYV